MSNKFITYFQSVITVGIITEDETLEGAQKKAEEKMEQNDAPYLGIFDQVPFELTDTEEWTGDKKE